MQQNLSTKVKRANRKKTSRAESLCQRRCWTHPSPHVSCVVLLEFVLHLLQTLLGSACSSRCVLIISSLSPDFIYRALSIRKMQRKVLYISKPNTCAHNTHTHTHTQTRSIEIHFKKQVWQLEGGSTTEGGIHTRRCPPLDSWEVPPPRTGDRNRKAVFFWLRRALGPVVTQGLLLGKQRALLAGRTLCLRMRWSQSTTQLADSKQSSGASRASWFHLLTALVDAGCLWTRGTVFGARRTGLWSDLPSGGRALAPVVPLAFA